MKKRITVVLTLDTNDEHMFTDNFIEQDIKSELHCASNFYNFESITMDTIEEHPPIGRWKKLEGSYMSPGGTPAYVCANCGGSEHLHGVEFSRRKIFCDDCGMVNVYPWETTYEEKLNG